MCNIWWILIINNFIVIVVITGHEEAGAGRLFTLEEPVSLSTVVKRVKNHLKLKHGKYKLIIDKDNNNDLGKKSLTLKKNNYAEKKLFNYSQYLYNCY